MYHIDHPIKYTGLQKIHRVIRKVCAHQDLDVLKRFLIKHPNDIKVRDANGNTVLMLAIRFHKTNVVPILQLLIASGADPSVKNKAGYDCRMCALIYDCPEAVEYLFKQGLNFNDELLFKLAVKYSEDSLTFLLNHISWSQKLKNKALDIVCKRNHSCLSLLEHGATPDTSSLLKICFGRLYHQPKEQRYIAHNQKVLQNIRHLVHQSPDLAYEICIDKMIPPFHYDDLIQIMKDEHVDLNRKDTTGNTLLHYACKKYLIQGPQMEHFIIEHHLDINVQDSSGNTPLYYMIQYDNYTIAEILLRMGCHMLSNNEGYSPLYYLIIRAPDCTPVNCHRDTVMGLIKLMVNNGGNLREATVALATRTTHIHPSIEACIKELIEQEIVIKEPGID